MKKHYFGHVKHVLMGFAALAAFTTAAMLLWNWLITDIFGLAAINFWQTLGLLALSRLLFGGFDKQWGGHGGREHDFHNPVRERWEKMTNEERHEWFRKNRRFGRRVNECFGNEETRDADSPQQDSPQQND